MLLDEDELLEQRMDGWYKMSISVKAINYLVKSQPTLTMNLPISNNFCSKLDILFCAGLLMQTRFQD